MRTDRSPRGNRVFAVVVASAMATFALTIDVRAQTTTPAGMHFTDVTLDAGIDFRETIGDDVMSNIVESAGVGCAFLDYDGDGWMDLYLVNGCWREGRSDAALDADQSQRLANHDRDVRPERWLL